MGESKAGYGSCRGGAVIVLIGTPNAVGVLVAYSQCRPTMTTNVPILVFTAGFRRAGEARHVVFFGFNAKQERTIVMRSLLALTLGLSTLLIRHDEVFTRHT